MLQQTLSTLFVRDLAILEKEIGLYRDEKKIWSIQPGISNSGGNLCSHLIGNLNTYIGAELGKTGYIRNRDLEFSVKDIPQQDLLEKIRETSVIVNNTLNKLTDEQLSADYPQVIFEKKMSTEYFLAHLAMHLSYHLGQINYHRRLLEP
ncbi:DUF1572 family protein [Flavitalea flava]